MKKGEEGKMIHIEVEYRLRKVNLLYINSLLKCESRTCIQHETTGGRTFGVCHQYHSVKYCCQDYLIQYWAKHKLWCNPIVNEKLEKNEGEVANLNDSLEQPQLNYEEVN